MPTNEAGLDTQQTLERIASKGKWTQAEANYIPEATENLCQNCRFFLAEQGACQVVEGEINENGHSDLYIEKEVEIQEQEETKDVTEFTSFLETEMKTAEQKTVDEITGLADQYPSLVKNIMDNPKITDKLAAIQNLSNEFELRTEHILRSNKERWQPLTDKLHTKLANLAGKATAKVEGGVSYSASDYAYVPDPSQPSTWKLRLAQGKSGNITVSQLGRAAAAFSPGGFRGNRVQIPQADIGKVKSRIRAAYRKLGIEPDKMPDSVKELNSFTLLKQDDGSTRWLAIYSNNILDDDNPPDILSAKAHKEFADRVEKGDVEYPELWLWHVKEWRLGKADAIAYSETDNVLLAIATGTLEEEAAPIFEILGGLQLGVSHGMEKKSIERDPDDPKVITRYVSKEISPLPLASAANKFTDFVLLGEEPMLKEDKKQELLEAGVPEAVLDRIEDITMATSKEVVDEKLETKGEAEETPVEEKQEEEIPVEEAQADESPDVAGMFKEVLTRLSAIEQKMTGTDAEVAGLKQVLNQTPAESLFGEVLKANDPILDKAPAITEGDAENQVPFFIDWVNNTQK